MKNWKLHAGWALVVLIVAGAWGRWCSSQRETESRIPQREVPNRAAEIRPAPPAAPEVAGSPPATLPAEVTPPSAPSVALPAYKFQPMTVAQIRALIRSGANNDWWRAAIVIDKLADPMLQKELLLELLAVCKDNQLRMNTLSTLRVLLGKESVPLLQKSALADTSPWVRGRAAEMLGELGGDGTLDVLLRATRDDDEKVRIYAAGALSRLGQSGSAADLIPRLSARLDNPDSAQRREAVEDLRELRTPLILPVLVRALADTSGDVRAAAAVGLAQLESPEVAPLLERLVKDPNPDVADAAKEGLELLKSRKGK